ncbi:MAG TPA: YkgJ family cysteine cluster protein [Kofleriaceae bacterium]|nr:YkgJ family cysteine cluster protein [Kofleriaceae bacterium]
MTTYRPRLRAHLRLDDAGLVDTLLARTLSLDGTARELASRLDGTADWTAIRAALVGGGHEADDVDDAMRGFLYLHAVEGAGDELAARLARAAARPADAPLVVMPGARFACQGSGSCCTGYSLGPLSDEDLAGLDALDLATAFPHVAPPYVILDDERGRFLRRDGDACVFLEDKNRCGIHARFGAGAKPGFCRLYPYDYFGTIEGTRVHDRGACATFGTSARVGLPIVDDLPRVRPLLETPVLYHPYAVVDGWAWDYGLFLRFTAAATAMVGSGLGTATSTFAAIGRLLDALARAMHDCPLEPGQPDAVVGAVLAEEPARWYDEPDHVTATISLRRLITMLDELALSMAAAAEQGLAQAAVKRFRAAVELIEYAVGRIVAHDGTAVVADHAADVDEALRISFQQQLFGRRFLVGGQAGTGLVRCGLVHLLALAGARLDAGQRPLTAADLSRGHMLATRVFHTGSVDRLLLEQEARWRDLVVGLTVAAGVIAAVDPAS